MNSELIRDRRQLNHQRTIVILREEFRDGSYNSVDWLRQIVKFDSCHPMTKKRKAAVGSRFDGRLQLGIPADLDFSLGSSNRRL
jgi:hypothetical protein